VIPIVGFVCWEPKIATFQVQRFINEYPQEPLLAILPGVTLSQLWELVSVAENTLLMVSACVVVVGLCGMLTALLTSLNERRRELAILRSVGARPWHLFALILGEAGCLTLFGVLAGMTLLYLALIIGQPLIASRFGIVVSIGAPTSGEGLLLGTVVVAGFLVGSFPGYRAYRLSLVDGLSVRV
jgi:putative ABC transport system permease protein